MNNIRTENWHGYNIRFVEVNGEWWAILKDICDALNMDASKTAKSLMDSGLGIGTTGIYVTQDDEYEYIVNQSGIFEVIYGFDNHTTKAFRNRAYWAIRSICEERK